MVKAQGHGLSECWECKKEGKYSLTWTNFLFRTEKDKFEHLYCFEHAKILENEEKRRKTMKIENKEKFLNEFLKKSDDIVTSVEFCVLDNFLNFRINKLLVDSSLLIYVDVSISGNNKSYKFFVRTTEEEEEKYESDY